jgi:hypothetical protein
VRSRFFRTVCRIGGTWQKAAPKALRYFHKKKPPPLIQVEAAQALPRWLLSKARYRVCSTSMRSVSNAGSEQRYGKPHARISSKSSARRTVEHEVLRAVGPYRSRGRRAQDWLLSCYSQDEARGGAVTLPSEAGTGILEPQWGQNSNGATRYKSLRHNGRGGIRTHGTLLTYTHFPGVRLKPLGHPSQHRFEAPPIGLLRATDFFELQTTANCGQRAPCAVRRDTKTDRERFELSIPGSPVCRFSRPVPSTTRPPVQQPPKLF